MITPIMASGVVAQTQNVNIINQGEDSKVQINYQNSQTVVESQREQAHNTVIASQDSDRADTRHDAKEEGKNKYFSNRNKQKKKPEEFGTVVKKNVQGGGFNVSV